MNEMKTPSEYTVASADVTIASTEYGCSADTSISAKLVGKKRKTWKKPKDKPKRPLSAYNIFFAQERQNLLDNGFMKSAAPGNFARLARAIASNWKALEDADKTVFEKQAKVEQDRYKIDLDRWKVEQEKKNHGNEQAQEGDNKTRPVEPNNLLSAQMFRGDEFLGTDKANGNAFSSCAIKRIDDVSNVTQSSNVLNVICLTNHPSNPSFRTLITQLDSEECNFLLSLTDL